MARASFPKSLNVGKAISKSGKSVEAEQWDGYGTALKPAWENIVLARKPLSEKTVAANVLKWGTGAINIDGCRVAGVKRSPEFRATLGVQERSGSLEGVKTPRANCDPTQGRWPANVVLSHHPDCKQVGVETVKGRQINRWKDGAKPFGGGAGHEFESEQFPDDEVPVYKCHTDCPLRLLDEQVGREGGGDRRGDCSGKRAAGFYGPGGDKGESTPNSTVYADKGGPSRFFYSPKASKKERNHGLPEGMANKHPTVKPVALMRYLARLVTPPGGTVLDPFMGSGSTGVAALAEGFGFLGVDSDPESVATARHRIGEAVKEITNESNQNSGNE